MEARISSRKTLMIAETTVLLIMLFFSPSNMMNATLTPYEIPGTITRYDVNYYWILDIQVDDTVIVDIIPDAGVFYSSQICYPNLTQVQDPYYDSGGHLYSFIAVETGNYILKIWSGIFEFDYTIKSSHEIPNGGIPYATPYNAIGKIQAYETAFHTIYGIKENETIFIAIISDSSDFYDSEVCYQNLSRAIDPPTHAWGAHSYEFIAQEDGDYRLKVWNNYALNYTIKCSNYVTSEPAIPDYSLTHTPETLTVEIGSSGNATITVHSHMGYMSDIILNATNMPTGVNAIFNPVLVALLPDGQVNSTLTINAGLTAQQGTTTLYITGKSGNLTRWCKLSLSIQEIENKLPSSISCYLNATYMTYTNNVLISATIEPALSTGIITIQTTNDNTTWKNLIMKVPSEGQCDFIWTSEAGTHFIQAKWSGDYNHLPCTSTTRKLTVDKKPTSLTITLSTNIADSGQYVTANATIHPSLSSQNIIIQYKTNESWQSLASGLTDQSGSFTHTWLPEGDRVFRVRSTWSGTNNYEGNSSKPEILIIEIGHPTIATHIEIENTTLKTEYREDAIVAYNVLDATSNLIRKNSEILNTLSMGTFDIWIIFLGDETHKSCFYDTNYTVTSIATKIENVRIASEYSVNLIELLLEYILGASGENKTYSGCSAHVTFEVRKAKSGDLIQECSLKLDTSTIGYNHIDLTYDGNETHSVPLSKSFRYKVLERIPIGTAIQMIIAVIAPVATLLIGWRTGLWRNWWQKMKKRKKKSREKKKRNSENKSNKKSENGKPRKQ